MNVLFLGPWGPVSDFLSNTEAVVKITEDKLSLETVIEGQFDFLVSYGYRHIIKKEILDLFPRRAINLHISYLPWNRGSDPNFWSVIDDTPKGVTIHLLDEGVDTGPILFQRRAVIDDTHTLKTSYEMLQTMIQLLFIEKWPLIREGNFISRPQSTYHRSKDKEPLMALLTKGWDTPISDIIQGRASHCA